MCISGHAWDDVFAYVKTCVPLFTPVHRSEVIVFNTCMDCFLTWHPRIDIVISQHKVTGLWRLHQLPRFTVIFSRVWSGYKKWSLSITHALIFEPTHTVLGSPSILEIDRRTQASSGSRSFPTATWPYKLRKFVFIPILLKQFFLLFLHICPHQVWLKV